MWHPTKSFVFINLSVTSNKSILNWIQVKTQLQENCVHHFTDLPNFRVVKIGKFVVVSPNLTEVNLISHFTMDINLW